MIASAPRTFVRYNCKVWVTIFAEAANDLWIIELVVHKEVLWVLIRVDFNLGKGIVHGWDLVALCDA